MNLARLLGMAMVFLSLAGYPFSQAIDAQMNDATTETLHFNTVLKPFWEHTMALEQFYIDAERRTDLDQAASKLITVLSQKGYRLKSVPTKKSIHYAKDIPVGECQAQCHLTSDDGLLTLDVIVFADEASAQSFSKLRGPRSTNGSSAPGRIAWLMCNGPNEKGELIALVRAGEMWLYLDRILPFSVTTGDAINQENLRVLKTEVNSFNEVANLVFMHLVASDDWVWMPQAGEHSLSVAERVGNFMYLWSEVKYNFANFDLVSQLNWDRERNRYLPLIEKARSNDEYFLLLQKLLAQLHDGHTSLLWDISGAWPSIGIQCIEGKAIITDLEKNDELTKADLKTGMEITKVDGLPVKDLLEMDRYPFICSSTPQYRDLVAYRELLKGPIDSKVVVSIRDINGREREVSLTRSGNWRSINPSSSFTYRALTDDIAYVALNSFSGQNLVIQFDKVFNEKISKAKGLIIDVRMNNGGRSDIGYDIIGRLIDKPLKASVAKTQQYLPALRALGHEAQSWYKLGENEVDPRGANPYLGPVIVLTSPFTVSAAEDFLVPLKASKRATLVGEKTAGSTGMPLFVNVGGGVQARICSKRDTYPDGSDFVGVGVIPDLEVHPTQKDIADERDAVLEAGIQKLRELMTNDKTTTVSMSTIIMDAPKNPNMARLQ